MGLLNYIGVFEDKHITISDEDIIDLEIEELLEVYSQNEAYENLLDMIVEKAKDITDGKYTLEELFKIEPDLDKFIPKDISQEDIYDVVNNNIEIMKLEKILNFNNNISLEEEIDGGNISKLGKVYNNVESKIREMISKVNVIEVLFGAALISLVEPHLKKLKNKIKEFDNFDDNLKKQLPKVFDHSEFDGNAKRKFLLSRDFLAHSKSLVITVVAIVAIISLYRYLKYNHTRQKQILNIGSKSKFKPAKIVRLLSKNELDKNIKIYDNLMNNVNKLLEIKNISSVDNLMNTLKSMGINVSKQGNLEGEKRIRLNKSLDAHGYVASDVGKYRKIHDNILDRQKKFILEIIKNKSLSMKDPNKINIDRKALRTLTKIIKKISKRTSYEIFHTAKALGR